MTDTMILAFNDTEVRSITEENEIWFALVDVCKILELSNPRRVAQRLDDDEKRNFKLRLPGRDPWFVEETRKIWVREFNGKVEPDFSPEIKRELSQIWEGDMPMFHKYLDKYHSDCYKKQKGKPILF